MPLPPATRSAQTEESPLPPRLAREIKTVAVMVDMYCRAHHRTTSAARRTQEGPELCPGCAELLHYSTARIRSCRFQDAKPTCAGCTVHCFRDSMRQHIREVMRHSGPRMILRHPYLAVRHLIDSRKARADKT